MSTDEKKKYVAYVGTYTHGSSIGIHLYDVDLEGGALVERKVIPVNNSSYVRRSNNGKYLYSIVDEGVAVFAIQPDGDLELIDKVRINGMRGCYITADQEGKYLVVAGYHDGKVTLLGLNEDGTLRFMLEAKYVQPMALADRKEGDAEALARVHQFNKALETSISTRREQAQHTLHAAFAGVPELNGTLQRLLLVDSDGQHKNRRNANRLPMAEDTEYEEVRIAAQPDTDDMELGQLY